MKTLIIAEKPDVATRIGALGSSLLGKFYLSNGTLLTPSYLAKNEKIAKSTVSRMGKLENDNFIIMFAAGHLVELYQAKDYDPKFKNWREIPNGYVPKPFKMKVKDSASSLFNSLKKTMNSPEVGEIIIATDADREGQAIFEYIYKMANCHKPCKRLWANAFTESGIEKAYKSMKDNIQYTGVKDAGYGRMTSDWIMGALLTAKTTIELSSGEILNVGRVQTAVLAEICRVENLIKNFTKQKSYQVVGTFKTPNGEIYEGVCDEKFDTLEKANKIIERLKGNRGNILESTREKENKWCPPLFDQTALAQEMSNKYGMSPDVTLATCQSLYEKGYQTYPRTGSRFIEDGDAEGFGKMLKEAKSINPLSTKHPFSKKDKRIVDTSKVESHGAIIPTENIPNLNELTLEQKQVYTEVLLRSIALTFPPAIDEKHAILTGIKDISFKSTGRVELERGFREVYDIDSVDNSLPLINKGENVEVIKLISKEVETKPPKRYTNASILNFMKTCGKNIENEDALELMKNKGIGTAATRAEILKKLFSNGYIITKGKTIYPTDKGMKLIEIFPVEEMKNPEFTGNLEYKLYQVEKNEISLEEYMDFIVLVYKDACNKLTTSDKKVLTASDDSLGLCPICKNGHITHKKGTKNGKAYDFYGCSNWKGGCKFTINGTMLSKKVTEKQVKSIIEKGETGKIKGFKNKAGKELPSAKLVLKDGKIELDWNC